MRRPPFVVPPSGGSRAPLVAAALRTFSPPSQGEQRRPPSDERGCRPTAVGAVVEGGRVKMFAEHRSRPFVVPPSGGSRAPLVVVGRAFVGHVETAYSRKPDASARDARPTDIQSQLGRMRNAGRHAPSLTRRASTEGARSRRSRRRRKSGGPISVHLSAALPCSPLPRRERGRTSVSLSRTGVRGRRGHGAAVSLPTD